MNKESRASLLLAFCWIAVVGVLGRVVATAQEPVTEERSSVDSKAAADESDLIARIRDCDVLTVTGEDFDAIFTVSGKVVSSDGSPVEGAFVVLRESSTSRISSESTKYIYVKDRHLLRTRDVFARTTTDAKGKFEFRETKSPAFPKAWTNSTRADVVAAHETLGVGQVSLASNTKRQRRDPDVTVVLRPTNPVSGRFVTPKNAPIENAIVSIERLFRLNTRIIGNDGFDLQTSQLTPRTETDAEGRFRLTGIPEGFAASVWLSHPEWIDRYAVIATSQDVPLGKQSGRSGYVRDTGVLGVPAEVVADPGHSVIVQVLDPDGKPVHDVRVDYSSSIIRGQTDHDGKFHFRIGSDAIERDRTRGEGTSTLYAWPPTESGLLPSSEDIPVDDLLAGKPVAIQLKRGVLVTGKVVTQDGDPVPNAFVRSVLNRRVGGKTESDGSYKFLLPKGQHMLVAGTEEPGYVLPNRSEVYRAKTEQGALLWPHQRVDLTAGVAKEIPAIVVSKVKSLQVIASLPDGQPAAGATAIIKDEVSATSARGFVMPPRKVDKSESVITNRLGRAELLPQGSPSDKAFVEVKLATDEHAYDASVPLSQAVDGVLNVVLKSAWIVEGRVLIDGEPVAGAKVSLGESTPNNRTVNGRTLRGSTVSNFVHVVTDEKGLYRAAVSPGKEYSVSLQSLPDDEARPGIGYRPTPAGEGRLTVKDFAFSRGDQELAGRVINPQGKAVAGAYVQVMRGRDVTPSFWVGHQSESQHETDQQGRFHLKKMPAGTYQLTVRGPRDENARRSASTMVTAKTGTMDVEVVLNAQPQTEIPRLQPKRIEPIQPSAGDQP